MDQDPSTSGVAPAPESAPDAAPETPPQRVKKRHILRHSHIVAMEIVAVLALLLALAGGMAAWRLQSGPVDVSFAKNYIQEALRVPERGLTPVIGKAALSWPDLQGPILLAVRDVKLFNADGQAVLALEEAELSLSRRMLLLGQISPIALILKDPVVQVVRAADGHFDFGILGLRSEKAPDDNPNPENKRVYTEILKYVARPDNEKDFRGLSNLEALIIKRGSLIIKDETLKSAWVMPKLDARLESNETSLNVDVQIDFTAPEGTDSYLKMHYILPWNEDKGELSGELKNFDPWFFAQQIPNLTHIKKGDIVLNGRVAAATDKTLSIQKFMGEIQSAKGTFMAPEISVEPVTFEDLIIQASYNRTTNKINLSRGEVKLQDLSMNAVGEATIGHDTIKGKARLNIPALAHSRVKDLWPPMLKGENAETWIVHKLSKGTLSDLFAEIELNAKKTNTGWVFEKKNITTGFSFDKMSADYRAPLWPVTNGRGKGVFDVTNDVLKIDVENGNIGKLAVKKSHLEFRDILKTGQGKADLNIALSGPLPEALRYIALEPIKRTLRFKPEDVKGDTDLNVNIKFPTHKNVKVEEVKVVVKGTLNNILLPAVVRDLPLTGGPFEMTVDDTKLHVTGKGFIASSDGNFDYTQNLNQSEKAPFETIKATVNTNPETRLQMGIDLSDFIDGVLPASIDYTGQHDKTAQVSVTADLTDTHVFFDPFDYDKKIGEGPATASLNAVLKEGTLISIDGFKVSAPDLKFSGATLGFKTKDASTKLSAGDFPDFTIGETKGAASFKIDDAGRYDIKATTSFLDLAPFLDTEPKKEHTGPAMQIDLKADTLRGEDKIPLRNGKFLFDMDQTGRYKKINVSAEVGKGKVNVLFAPDETGAYRFAMDTDDAGATLAAFGVYQNIRGGTMKIRGKPEKTPDDPDMQGTASINDFRVVNAPTLARLISALSLPGLAALLNNEGLSFKKLEAGYVWDYKPEGAILNIKDGRTTGNSVGFTFEGKVDQSTNTMNINYDKYLHSSIWKRKRAEILKRCGGFCEHCGKQS